VGDCFVPRSDGEGLHFYSFNLREIKNFEGMKRFLTGFFLWMVCGSWGVTGQEVYRTEVMSPVVKSLRLWVEDELVSEPFIELGGSKRLAVSFDVLNHSQGRYAYSVIHCDADWRRSGLAPMEYMSGYEGVPIDDFAMAMTTTTHYTNYRLSLPNEEVGLKVSGNYALVVYEEDAPDRVVFRARFWVYEDLTVVEGAVRGNTDRSFNTFFQQLSFQLSFRELNIRYPQTDLKVNIYQNGRTDNAVAGVQPSLVMNGRLVYDHIESLIFEGGNEYRRIEFLTHRYNGLGIERIDFFNPYYHAEVMAEGSREGKPYLYDEDQNGRFFVGCSGCRDVDTEGDYYIVHFGFASDRLRGGELYLLGDFLQNRFDGASRMTYNSESGRYEKALLLKQGLYNYEYAFVADGSSRGTVRPAEGSHFQTENEYAILVYYRPSGARYDRLIGHLTVRSR
jgi:hypothetical protein